MKLFRTVHSHVLLVAAMFLPDFALAQAMCPVTGGSTSCDQAATSRPPASSTGAGNPIDVTSGNKYQREVDFQYPGELGLGLIRHYNSTGAGGRAFGPGWTHSFETRLTRSQAGGKVVVTIVQSDGRTLQFREQAAGATGTTSYRDVGGQQGIIDEDSRALERLRRIRDGQGSALDVGGIGGLEPWVWRWPDGRRLTFDGRGRLRQVALVNGARLDAEYDGADRLVSVRDDAARAMQISYWDDAADRLESFGNSRRATIRGKRGLVKSVKLPDGREVSYGYDDAGMLNAVRTPDGGLRRYEYLVIAGSSRLSRLIVNDEVVGEYGYDDYGRANYSAADGHEVRLEYVGQDRDGYGGTTRVDAAGAQTVYRWRAMPGTDQRQIVEARGPGCSSCPPSNVRYRTDRAGRLVATEELAPATDPLKSRAVPASIERYHYDDVGRVRELVRVDAEGREQLVTRLSFASNDLYAQPTLVERPSVVPGRLHRVKITYDEHQRVIAAEEWGYAPALAATASHAASPARELHRAIALRHQRRGARLVLAEVDGPLPGRGDVLNLDWDARGVSLERVRYPLGVERSWKFDPVSDRLLREVPEDGVAIDYQYDPRGLLTARARGGAVLEIRNDQHGRANRFNLPDGEVLHVAYDGPGASVALLSNRGIARWLRAPRSSQAVAAATAPLADLPTLDFADLEEALPGWGNTELVFDDFGRVVAARTSATGQERFAYDETDRTIERRFADGVVWEYERDALGRVVTHRRGAGGDSRATGLAYDRHSLTGVEDDVESVKTHVDSQGRIDARTVTRASVAGERQRYSERMSFDAAGRLTEHFLPEGGALVYGWGIGSELKSVEYRDASGEELRLVSAGSASGFTYGNGISYQGTLGKDGRLESFQYRAPAVPMTVDSGGGLIPRANASEGQRSLVDVRLEFGRSGKLLARHDNGSVTRFAYDDLGRIIVVDDPVAERESQYFTYNLRGDLLARRVGGFTQKFDPRGIVRGAGGLPERVGSPLGERRLRYSADRRLTEVRDGERLVARYVHNAYGERIAKTVFTGGAAATTEYFYLDHRLVGESLPGAPGHIARRYVYARDVPIAVIDYPAPRPMDRQPAADEEAPGIVGASLAWLGGTWSNWVDGAARVTFIHTNEIGTPIAATDDGAQVVWRPEYLAYGAIRAYRGPVAFTLNLRLPGQYYDAETGWHDNYLRTYDPARGQYLEPDPLGPVPNFKSGRQLTQPFAYVNHDPLLHADPLGLVLIPFDGTNNHRNDLTNVWYFAEHYASFNAYDLSADITGTTYYVNGVGTEGFGDGIFRGSAFARTMRERVDRGLGFLDNYLDGYLRWEHNHRDQLGLPPLSASDPITIDLDTVGFSRGAATAREFINRVLDRIEEGYYDRRTGGCFRINLRMMALFETVLARNPGEGWFASGPPFRMVIPDEVAYVAHATAVNEHREEFPLEMINPSQAAVNAPGDFRANRVERGFVGAHSDIGGGYNGEAASGEDYDGGDLSDVALNWMMQQAGIAGLTMRPLEQDLREVTNPILHDPRRSWEWSTFDDRDGDRDIRFRGTGDRNSTTMAWTHMLEITMPGGMSNALSRDFIAYLPDVGTLDTRVGMVRMCPYLEWINSHYGTSMSCQTSR